MKQLLFTAMFLALLPLAAFSQEKPASTAVQSKSNLETFLERSGSLIKKEYITIGKVKGISVQVLTLTDIIKNTSLSGIRMEGAAGGASYSSDTKIAFLDKDEVENFIKAIDYINTNVMSSPATGSTEVIYSSRGGFSGGAFVDSKNKWATFLKLEKYDSRSTFFLTAEDFTQLKDLILQAKAKM